MARGPMRAAVLAWMLALGSEATARGIPDSRLLLLPGRGHVTALFDRGGSRAIADFLNAPHRVS